MTAANDREHRESVTDLYEAALESEKIASAASTFAWLIEAGPYADGAYWWWASPGWVTDALLATRYATKDEADAAAAESNLSARTVEHGFMGSADAAN